MRLTPFVVRDSQWRFAVTCREFLVSVRSIRRLEFTSRGPFYFFSQCRRLVAVTSKSQKLSAGPKSRKGSAGIILTFFSCSGDEGNRTLNPCLAKAVLSQLSYVPVAGRKLSVARGTAL